MSYQTILARAADDLDQIVDDLDLAARLAARDERMAITARALQAHDMATRLREWASGAKGMRGRRGVVILDELAAFGRLREMIKKGGAKHGG